MIYTISQIITQSALRLPDKIAFQSGSESITYSEADRKTNQIAHFLIDNGLKKGDRVGVFLNRNVKSALAVHGILKAGGTFVPIDVDAPIERIHYILEDCNIKHIITEERLAKDLQPVFKLISTKLVILGMQSNQSPHVFLAWENLNNFQDHLPEKKILSSDLAYIMYTSGTTGFPKGIMHTHYSGLSYAKLSRDLYDITDEDVIVNHSPLHFDMCTLGYLTAPLAGAKCIILEKQYSAFPASLSKLIEKNKITIWYSVPLVLQQLVERGDLINRDFSSIRWVLFGGEPIPVHQLNQFMQQCPNAFFSNVYGPAEVNQCTYFNQQGKVDKFESLPLGVVWNDTDYLILNEEKQEVQQGEVGELLIHSSTMMAGYWNNPERTQSSILNIESRSSLKKKFYKTGDLVREDKDGLIYFIGRKDRQIKSRGHRIELNEIEQTILKFDEAEQTACYTHTFNGINEIFASVVLKSEAKLEELEKKLRKSLPKYSVPKLILETKKLPRTSAGKVDYKKLTENIRSIYDSKN
jgi:amino acid adenylation domain-containing protein